MLDNSTAAPIANIVVPTGTDFELSGYLVGDSGLPQWIDVSNGENGGMIAFSASGIGGRKGDITD